LKLTGTHNELLAGADANTLTLASASRRLDGLRAVASEKENNMPNLSLLSILAIMLTNYFGTMWVVKMINDRNDEILTGVVKGTLISTRDRQLMLFTNWLPYVAFLVAFQLVMSVGLYGLGRGAKETTAEIVAYAGSVMCAVAATFWVVLGPFVFVGMLNAVRKAG
jgi:hypothetical protein